MIRFWKKGYDDYEDVKFNKSFCIADYFVGHRGRWATKLPISLRGNYGAGNGHT